MCIGVFATDSLNLQAQKMGAWQPLQLSSVFFPKAACWWLGIHSHMNQGYHIILTIFFILDFDDKVAYISENWPCCNIEIIVPPVGAVK